MSKEQDIEAIQKQEDREFNLEYAFSFQPHYCRVFISIGKKERACGGLSLLYR
jgi:hypothetical protein